MPDGGDDGLETWQAPRGPKTKLVAWLILGLLAVAVGAMVLAIVSGG
jgi:hypothetical protein